MAALILKLERERLSPAVNLTAAVAGERVDRSTRKARVFGEQPAHCLGVFKAGVEQDRQQPGQALEYVTVFDEDVRHVQHAVTTLGEQLVVTDQLANPGDWDLETFGNIGERKPFHGPSVNHPTMHLRRHSVNDVDDRVPRHRSAQVGHHSLDQPAGGLLRHAGQMR